jgi:hypothetical protein
LVLKEMVAPQELREPKALRVLGDLKVLKVR